MILGKAPVLKYSHQHIGRYLTKKLFNIGFQCVIHRSISPIDMSHTIASKNNLKALNYKI